jgi:hypothetical protein
MYKISTKTSQSKRMYGLSTPPDAPISSHHSSHPMAAQQVYLVAAKVKKEGIHSYVYMSIHIQETDERDMFLFWVH